MRRSGTCGDCLHWVDFGDAEGFGPDEGVCYRDAERPRFRRRGCGACVCALARDGLAAAAPRPERKGGE